jgi:hypothetical protein
VLPGLRCREFDLALIDGRHGFPQPFIDWHYMAEVLVPGAMLIIDDLHLWTCMLLRDFLVSDADWELTRETSRSAFFVMHARHSQSKEWLYQPYVVKRSRGTSLLSEAGYLLKVLARGDFRLFWYPFGRRLRILIGANSDRIEKDTVRKVLEEISLSDRQRPAVEPGGDGENR